MGNTYADNLTIESDTLGTGTTQQVAVCLNNPDHQYVAFQFDMVLPEGIRIASDDNGRYMASINPERTKGHSLSVSSVGANTYRFLSFSMNNAELSGTSGPIINITLETDAEISEGSKAVAIMSQTFIDAKNTAGAWSDESFTIEVKKGAVPKKFPIPAAKTKNNPTAGMNVDPE